MLRCDKSSGQYKVEFISLHAKEKERVQILGHHDLFLIHDNGDRVLVEAAPYVDSDELFKGELCEHEVQWLAGTPGKDFRLDYKFIVTKL